MQTSEPELLKYYSLHICVAPFVSNVPFQMLIRFHAQCNPPVNRDENVEFDDGTKRIEKMRTEEIRTRAGVASRLYVRTLEKLDWVGHVLT